MNRRVEVHRGGRRGTANGPPVPNAGADISVVSNGDYIHYYPSHTAFEIARTWTGGYLAFFEIGDDGQPTALHFTPAPGGGFKLRQGKTGRPHFYAPTIDIGTPDHSTGLRPVEEFAISDREISVRLPFRFHLNGTPTMEAANG